MSEQGQPMTPEEYRAAMWEQAERDHAAALAEQQQQAPPEQENGQQEQQQRSDLYKPIGEMRPPAGAPQLPQFPQIPVTDFSKGVSYGIAAGIVVGGIAVVYFLNKERDSGWTTEE